MESRYAGAQYELNIMPENTKMNTHPSFQKRSRATGQGLVVDGPVSGPVWVWGRNRPRTLERSFPVLWLFLLFTDNMGNPE